MARPAVSLVLTAMLLLVAERGRAQNKYADPELTPKDREHWSFKAPKRSEPPFVRDKNEVIRNPIDAFVLARLEKAGLNTARSGQDAHSTRHT